jgi:hypothetical protein
MSGDRQCVFLTGSERNEKGMQMFLHTLDKPPAERLIKTLNRPRRVEHCRQFPGQEKTGWLLWQASS